MEMNPSTRSFIYNFQYIIHQSKYKLIPHYVRTGEGCVCVLYTLITKTKVTLKFCEVELFQPVWFGIL